MAYLFQLLGTNGSPHRPRSQLYSCMGLHSNLIGKAPLEVVVFRVLKRIARKKSLGP